MDKSDGEVMLVIWWGKGRKLKVRMETEMWMEGIDEAKADPGREEEEEAEELLLLLLERGREG